MYMIQVRHFPETPPLADSILKEVWLLAHYDGNQVLNKFGHIIKGVFKDLGNLRDAFWVLRLCQEAGPGTRVPVHGLGQTGVLN